MRVLSDHKSLESPFQSFLMFNRIQTHTHMYIYICLQAWISLILAGTIMYASVDWNNLVIQWIPAVCINWKAQFLVMISGSLTTAIPGPSFWRRVDRILGTCHWELIGIVGSSCSSIWKQLEHPTIYNPHQSLYPGDQNRYVDVHSPIHTRNQWTSWVLTHPQLVLRLFRHCACLCETWPGHSLPLWTVQKPVEPPVPTTEVVFPEEGATWMCVPPSKWFNSSFSESISQPG